MPACAVGVRFDDRLRIISLLLAICLHAAHACWCSKKKPTLQFRRFPSRRSSEYELNSQSLCYLKKGGVCIRVDFAAGACPFPGAREWWSGCPAGFRCCIPPKALIQRADTPGGCGFPPLLETAVLAERIVGGWPVRLGERPWQALLLFGRESQCGGAVVHRRWILTAAHCFVHSASPGRYSVVTGAVERSGRGRFAQTRRVARILLHPDFRSAQFRFDIALVELARPLALDNFTVAVCLPRADDSFENVVCSTAGWGHYHAQLKRKSWRLRGLNLPVVPLPQCREFVRRMYAAQGVDYRLYPVSEAQLCTMYPSGGRETCSGDSGGPLACRMDSGQWILAGVVSFGEDECGKPNAPAIYTKVAAYLSWIHRHMDGQ